MSTDDFAGKDGLKNPGPGFGGSMKSDYPDDSWFWPILDEYRDGKGRTISEIDYPRWRLSPKPERQVNYQIQVINDHFGPTDCFSYFEFGVCFGTTFTQVLSWFPKANGIGLEINPKRFEVAKWMVERPFGGKNLAGRTRFHQIGFEDYPLSANSIDVVFMDTNHQYPDEFNYIIRLLESGALRKNYLFLIDDPFHTGTDIARRRLIEERSDSLEIHTVGEWGLWWFKERDGGDA